MFGDHFGHFKHGDGGATVEDLFEGIVGVDGGLGFGILKAVFFDVFPELFGEFSSGKGVGTNDRSEGFIGLDRLHEGCVWFAFGGRFRFCHPGIRGELEGESTPICR